MADFKRKTYAEKKEELDALTRQLTDGIHDYIGSQRYTAVLDSISRFYKKYSLSNCILIDLQTQGQAQKVASFTTWKSLNRSVNKGERGIAIFCPVKYKTEKEVEKLDPDGNKVLDIDGRPILEKKLVDRTTFKIGYVFDVSQTSQIEGKKEYPLTFVDDLRFDVEDFDCYMPALKEVSPVPIEVQKFRSAAKGYFSNSEQKIVIQSGMSEAQTLKTAIHEVAHSYLHNKNDPEDHKLTYCVAECAEFPSYGEYHDNLTLDKAIQLYERIPSEHLNAGKCIGFELHDDSIYADGMFPLVVDGKIQIDSINNIKHYRESFEVQKAIMAMREYFPDDGYSLKSTRELQAESIAYVVCQHYGIDTSDYSLGYVTSWLEDEEQLMKNLDTIKVCSSEIIDKMDITLKQAIQEKYDIHTPEEMTIQIDQYLQKLDLYEYRDQEVHPGSIFKETMRDIQEGHTAHIEKFLKETICDDRDVKMTEKAKNLLKCLKTFQKEGPLESLTRSRNRGMKR